MIDYRRKDQVLQEIRESAVDFADTTTGAGVQAVASQLSQLTFATGSVCGMVTAVHDGASALVDIVVSDRAFSYYDSQRMAQVITRTIQVGEATVREALREAVAGAGEGR